MKHGICEELKGQWLKEGIMVQSGSEQKTEGTLK
jgi:hypothetical protein